MLDPATFIVLFLILSTACLGGLLLTTLFSWFGLLANSKLLEEYSDSKNSDRDLWKDNPRMRNCAIASAIIGLMFLFLCLLLALIAINALRAASA